MTAWGQERRAKLKMIKEEMWRRMHQPPRARKWLGRVVSGYFDYHAVPTNGRALAVLGITSLTFGGIR
jgi:RNA-directed DNA polymerase